MKKTTILCALAAATLTMGSCGTSNSTLSQVGTQVLTDVLLGTTGTTTTSTTSTGTTSAGTASTGAATGGALGNILTSVLGGSSKPTQKQIIGNWTYAQPGCAFTSDKLLAQAGGEMVAAEIKQKLAPTYQKIGIKSGNTSLTLKEDKTFAASFAGKSFSGTYTYDESTQQLSMKGLLLNLNGYVKRNANGIALLFESSKLLTLLQTIAALSGNTTMQTVGEISKSYDGLRLGFDFQ